MPLLRRVARPMLASIFLVGGINELRNPKAHAEAAKPVLDYAAPVIDKAVEVAPIDRRPDDETLIKIEASVKIAAGTLLALGKAPRLASAALAGTLVPTTLAGHRFWEESDPHARQQQQAEFVKNIALLGGLLIAAADTHGKPSLAWRGRKAAQAASLVVGKQADAVSTAAHEATEKVSELAAGLAGIGSGAAAAGTSTYAQKAPVVRARAAELGSTLSEKATHASHTASERAAAASHRAALLGSAASHKAAELGTVAAERASHLGGVAAERAAELGGVAAGRAAELGGVAAGRAAELRGVAVVRASEVGGDLSKRVARAQKEAEKKGAELQKLLDKKGAEWEKLAEKQGDRWAKAAEKKRAEWEKQARKAVKQAKKRAPHYADELSARLDAIREQAVKFGGDVAERASGMGSVVGSAGAAAIEGIAKDARKRAAKIA